MREIQKIDRLLQDIDECSAIIRSNGDYKKFKVFITTGKTSKKPGLSYSNIRAWVKKLKDLRKILTDKKSESLLFTAKEELDKIELKILFFQEKVEAFVKEGLSRNQQRRRFLIYTYHEVKRTTEPMLQVGKLEINSEAIVTYTCISSLSIRTFTGTFEHTGNNIAIFDLSSVGELRNKLQMQIYFQEQGRGELFLGSYITYENGRIVHGTLVMCHDLVDDDSVMPFTVSYKQDLKKMQQINPIIIEYLSIRKYSYKRVPDEIFSIEALSNFLTSGFHESPQKRFIEKDKPQIIFAYPSSSISTNNFSITNSILNQIKNSIEETFPHKMNIYIRGENMQKYFKEATAPVSLNLIQRTRIFFLVYTATQKASFSLVQLGWAMAHCKHIVVIYEKHSLSPNLKRLETFKNLFTFYEITSIEDKMAQEQILGFVRKTIIGSLANYLKMP